MSTSNQADIDSLLADYSERVAEYGLNSLETQRFYDEHSSDGDFVELAGVLRHLRDSPPRIAVPAQSRVRLLPLGLAGAAFLLLLGSTTWLAVDRAMDERQLAFREPVKELAVAATVDRAMDERLLMLELAEAATVDRAMDARRLDRAMDARRLAFREPVMQELAEAAATRSVLSHSLALRGNEGDTRELAARLLVDTFMSDATTANLLAEAFLRDATASQPIDLPKLNLAYAFARLAVALDTSPRDAGSDEAVQPTGGRILDTYGHVLDAITEAMRDHGEESFILTLDLSSGEAWQRVIAAFEAILEHPLIDEESKARAQQRVKALTIAGLERNPDEDGN